jgi:glyoxylase-like metal-dependent hydrolase (beta-lactamase superfamily II)
MTELVEGVERIELEVGGRPLYLFLFRGERTLLLDAGCAGNAPPLDGLDFLLVTHPDLDHQGGVHALRERNPSLVLCCGLADVPLVSDPDVLVERRYGAFRADHGIAYDDETVAWMRRESGEAERVDVGVVGGETIRLSRDWRLRVLHVPGHSPGHLALFDERSRALFTADCVQGSVYLGLDGTPKLCPTYTAVDPYLATISQIEELAPQELHGCHWPAQRGDDVQAFLDETRAYVEQIDALVRDALAEPRTLRELIVRVNERLERPWPDGLAQELVYSVHGHAERLATKERRDGVVVYRR